MKPEYLRPRGVKRPRGLSQGVRFGDYIFVSGQMAWNKDGKIVDKANFRAQFERALDNVVGVLALAGASLSDVVKLTYYVTDQRYYDAHTEVRKHALAKDAPASAVLFVSSLAVPEALIEVEAIAYVGRDKTVYHWPNMVRPPGFSPMVKAGDLLFLAGQVPLGPNMEVIGKGDPGAQVGATLDNVERVLKLAGAANRDVIKLLTFITNPMLYPHYHHRRTRYFPHEPASTTVVSSMAWPQLVVETEAIAALGGRFDLLNTPGWKRPPGLSQAVRVGDLVFTSGLVARSRAGRLVGKGDARVQLENIISNMRKVLKLGGAGLKDIIKLNMYMTSPIYIPTWVEVRDRHLGKRTPPPASTTVVVPSLVSPDYLAELEAVAVVPS